MCSSLIGDPLPIVKWFVKENNIDLVISGGHITSHSEDVFSRTISYQLMQQLSVPYLSVKNVDAQKVKVNTIAVVREFVDPAKRNLEFINQLQEETGAKILMVKINTPNSHMEAGELKNKMDQFAELNGLKNVEQVTIESSDKETAIKDLIQKHDVDLLTLGHIHRNGISSFLRGDLRSDVLNHINMPIYIY
jgi:UDP-2,3-diacylglucosamine pyrophosphatase LpxH